jgi:uncharacterized lipoprotein NlpE involved in copper resistance
MSDLNHRPFEGYRAAAVIAIIALCIGLVAYAAHERREVSRVTAQATQAASALAENRSQINALTSKVNEMSAAEQARQASAEEAARRVRTASGHRRRAEDPRWKKFQSQLEAQQQAIDSTRKDLTSALDSTKTELSGSIARTHDELVLLEKRGERSYYEFDINKSKQFRPTGPVAIKLRKANTKHQYADLQLMVDDAQLDKKHVNIYEPVTFLNTDSGQPVQLVIQSIHGYVSEPKYKAAQLTATTTSAPDANAATQTAPPERRKLALPR